MILGELGVDSDTISDFKGPALKLQSRGRTVEQIGQIFGVTGNYIQQQIAQTDPRVYSRRLPNVVQPRQRRKRRDAPGM